MFGFFKKNKDVSKLKEEVYHSFNSVKKDINKVGEWVAHFDAKHKNFDKELVELKDQLYYIREDLNEIKDFVSFFGPQLTKQPFKQAQTGRDKQTAVQAVQTPVQTAVQTGILSGLTVMERAIVFALLNSDVKLSYEDLAAVLGKDKSTIRGQINGIRQKSEGLIEESIEPNGKKRIYIPEKMKEFVLKSVKVRVRPDKRAKKY
ncbi:MAG: hypothetical protein Q7S33_05325 [Nanoarchaeota archaeon]|nr:hypothetical protein [Nanoarchaeota archaeon]